VRNAVERARLRHASQPAGALRKDDLMRLELGDFLASRVFSRDAGDPAATA
jgi:hypothetical protein